MAFCEEGVQDEVRLYLTFFKQCAITLKKMTQQHHAA